MSDTPITDLNCLRAEALKTLSGTGTKIVLAAVSSDLEHKLNAANARIAHLEKCCAAQNEEVCQTAGKVLGYPWFKDDQKNFPNANESDGVCVGEHVAETIVAELAEKYQECIAMLDKWKTYAERLEESGHNMMSDLKHSYGETKSIAEWHKAKESKP